MADPESPLLITISLLLRKLKTQEVRHSIPVTAKTNKTRKKANKKKYALLMHSTKCEGQQVPLASQKGQVLSEVKHVKIDWSIY